MCSIGGRHRSHGVSRGGAISEIPPLNTWISNLRPVNPGGGQCQRVSLTGAVSSKIVTEEHEGTLSTVGNRAQSVRVEVCLTVRHTSRTDATAGPSDPAMERGIVVAQRTKGTPGITG